MLMRGLLLVGLAIAGIGMATSAEAACLLKGKGVVCKGGLAAMTLLVTDKDWQKKWNTSRESTPHLKTTDSLGKGRGATLLTFFAVDKSGMLELSCDMKIKDATGPAQTHPMQLCFRGEVTAGDIYMTGASVAVSNEGESGKTQFTVGLRNEATGAQVSLKTAVTYEP